MSVAEIAKRLGRPVAGTSSQIQRRGGKRAFVDAWTTKQISLLRKLYPDPLISADDLIAAFPTKRKSTIRAKAKKLGLRRPRVKGATGLGLVDQLSAIINEQGIAAKAVFEEAGLCRATATEWFTRGSVPTISRFESVLNELGFRLAIVPAENA